MPTKPVVNRKMAMVRQCSWNAWDGWSQWSPHLSLRVPWCPMVSPCPPWRIDVFQHPSADCSASSTAWPSWKIIGVIHSSMKKHKVLFFVPPIFPKAPDVRQISPFYHFLLLSPDVVRPCNYTFLVSCLNSHFVSKFAHLSWLNPYLFCGKKNRCLLVKSSVLVDWGPPWCWCTARWGRVNWSISPEVERTDGKIIKNHGKSSKIDGWDGWIHWPDLFQWPPFNFQLHDSTPEAGMQTPQIGSSPISDSRTPPGMGGYHVTKHRWHVDFRGWCWHVLTTSD